MIRTEHPHALSFVLSTLFCTLIGIVACLSVKTLVGMYIPALGAWCVGVAVAFLPAFLMNRRLTNSFRRIHFQDAPEWRSLFGAVGLVGSVLLVALVAGAAGLPGQVAVEEALCQCGQPFGFAEASTMTVVDTFPGAVADGPGIWVPTVGSGSSRRVIARNDWGNLKAMHLPRSGEQLQATPTARVGYVDTHHGRARLYPDQLPVSVQTTSHPTADEPENQSAPASETSLLGRLFGSRAPSLHIDGGSVVIDGGNGERVVVDGDRGSVVLDGGNGERVVVDGETGNVNLRGDGGYLSVDGRRGRVSMRAWK